MALTDSATGKIIQAYSIEQLKDAANLMRGYDLVSLCAAGSGHSGGTLSIMDIVAALYLHVAQHDSKNPNWPDRDRIIWSAGHKAPALYVGLGFAGFCDINDVVTLRKLHSRFQGHPHWLKLPGVEVSSGSLGQGLSIAVGMALSARLDGKSHKIFCLMGDGEQQEGQVWEAAMEAGHYKLDNIIAVIDVNRLQIDGWVKDVMQVEPLDSKYASFGWEVLRVNGHDMKQLVDAFEKAKTLVGKPVVILADTVKGKGVSFMENVAGWTQYVALPLPPAPVRIAPPNFRSTAPTATRASTISTPVSSTSNGLISRSRSSGISAAICASLTRTIATASVLDRGHVAIGAQQPRDTGPPDKVAGQLQIERRKRQRLVVDDLDRRAAVAEHDDSAKGRIVGEAQNQLTRLRPHHHRLNNRRRKSAPPGAALSPARGYRAVAARTASTLVRLRTTPPTSDL